MEGKMPNAGNKLVIETAPWTNGDAIRAMSDEELALYLDNMQGLAYINGFDSEPIRLYQSNYCEWLDWLRQEAKT